MSDEKVEKTGKEQLAETAAKIKAEAEEKKAKKVIKTKADAEEVVEQMQSKETAVVVKEPEEIAPAMIDQKTGQLIMTPKHVELIKTQIAKNATPEEFDLFMMMVRRTRLDPLLKQLYFFKYKNRRASEANGCKCYGECTCGKAVYNSATYVTSIDGLRIIAHRTGQFDGVDEPEYKYISNKLYSCSIKVYKAGCKHAFAATVKFAEYTTNKDLWAKMPETMIAKVAEAHALRKAFPQDLSGIYTTDEMDQAGEASKPEQKALPAKPAVPMMTQGQITDLKILMEGKKIGIERVKAFVKKAFGLDTLKDMTKAQADVLLKKIDELPTPEADPVDAAADEAFGTGQPTEAEDVDLDEVDEGIERMRAEEAAAKGGAL